MQMHHRKFLIPYKLQLTGLRWNYDDTITLIGQHTLGAGGFTGTAAQFSDTFPLVLWKPNDPA